MNHCIRWSILAVGALSLVTMVTTQPAYADTITGSYVVPGNGEGKTFPLQNGSFDPDPRLVGCAPTSLLVDVAQYAIDNPFVFYVEQFRIRCFETQEAVFSYVPPAEFPPGTALLDPNNFQDPTPNGVIQTQVHLESNNTGIDLTDFTDAFFVVRFSGMRIDPNGDGRVTWPVGANLVTVRFELTSIPEPGSLALAACGLAGLAGTGWFRRRGRIGC